VLGIIGQRERTVGNVKSAGKIAFERSTVKETGVQGEFTDFEFIRWLSLFYSGFLSIVTECGQAPIDRSGEFDTIDLKYLKVR